MSKRDIYNTLLRSGMTEASPGQWYNGEYELTYIY